MTDATAERLFDSVGSTPALDAAVPLPTALEVDFPAGPLSRIAERESWRKEVHRPATSTHKWWAKRLGSVFRGIIVASLTDSGTQMLNVYENGARLDAITVFDPFAGSGTTVVEAAKLGANVIGWDINPVATLVQRQAVQAWDPDELDRAYRSVEQKSRGEIDRVHRAESGETSLYYFWVATVPCPECSAMTRLFSSHVFARHAYPQRVPSAQLVCPECLDVVEGVYNFTSAKCSNGHEFGREGAVSGGTMTCPNGHQSSVLTALGGRAPSHEMYAKLVLGFDGKKRYERISSFDRELYSECEDLLDRDSSSLLMPRGRLEDGENTKQAIRWGFSEWRQFFNARQLYSLGVLGAAVRDVQAAPREREALCALFSGTLEFNNLFCSFKGEGTGAVRHMFSHHILKPERTPLEAHPWGTPASSGSFSTLYESRLVRAHLYKSDPADQVLNGDSVDRIRGASRPLHRKVVESWVEMRSEPDCVYLRTGDSSETDIPSATVDLVVTDPPYMDNVHYSELADFFHAWLAPLGPFAAYPGSSPTTRDAKEVQSASPDDFGAAIGAVWCECSRVLKDDGLLAFTFHQARVSGWIALIEGLASAGLVVTSIQPVKGEMSTSATKYGREPSNLDAIVVCRKLATVSGDAPDRDATSACASAMGRLAALRDEGIPVGAGDIRSVIRGNVLATYTADASLDMVALVELADELATEAVDQGSATAVDQGT
jgi:putative DNA methylase